MLIIRLLMVHMGPQHTQCGQKTARLAPVLQMGLKGHVRGLSSKPAPLVRSKARSMNLFSAHCQPCSWHSPSQTALFGRPLACALPIRVRVRIKVGGSVRRCCYRGTGATLGWVKMPSTSQLRSLYRPTVSHIWCLVGPASPG